jgi:DhnA family fructose-bisphosphate aldolase class Ia
VVSRIGAEYGGDMIKTVYSGDPEQFACAVQQSTLPVVVAGGPKTGSDAELLAMVKDCMLAGAAGITIGRNVWQRQRVEEMMLPMRHRP